MATVLLVDDEPRILSLLHNLLKNEGLDVISVGGGAEAIEIINTRLLDLVVSDIRMSPVDGMEVFRAARQQQPDTPVILLTAYGAVNTAIEAMKGGAFDYLTKPFKVDELLITVRRAISYRNLVSERDHLKMALEASYQFENVIAQSAKMRQICEMVKRVAPTDTTVTINGESGTGKEVIARAIHGSSRRRNQPFVAVNCAAIPEALIESEMFGHVKGAFTGATSNNPGLFVTADGGTLFLDEISSLPLGLQGKFLRVLQEQEVRPVGGTSSAKINVRVLAASNADLEKMVEEKSLREDLYYRLAVISMELPPLRERQEDILPLTKHFIDREMGASDHKVRVSREAVDILCGYEWPGNVRELENAVKHAIAFIQNDIITPDVLPTRVVKQSKTSSIPTPTDKFEQYRYQSLKAFLRSQEREYLEHVLEDVEGDKGKAAKALQISLATLYRKLPGGQEAGEAGETELQ